MSKNYKVVSFYTQGNAYEQYAERLRQSLLKHDIPHELTPVSIAGNWERICAHKSTFIREKWHQSPLPIVWLDADATVEQKPTLFDEIDSDFAIHKWDGWQFATGTIYFGKSEAVKKLLDQWVLRCEAAPDTWDQIHLQSAWCDISALFGINATWLRRSYCQIFDQAASEPPVIKHWQASRAEVRQQALGHTHHGMALRKSYDPWRNAEEAFWIAQGEDHIIPNTGDAFPEGDYVSEVLHRCVNSQWPLLEFGCGIGRIASLFKPDEYIGVDINPHALITVRARLPEHIFHITDEGLCLPDAPTLLFYTVLLHVSDHALPVFLKDRTTNRKRVIIAEVMDRRWRRNGNPPVFNRDPEDYILLMQQCGFRLSMSEKHAYKRYDMQPWNVGRDSRLTFLCFDKDE